MDFALTLVCMAVIGAACFLWGMRFCNPRCCRIGCGHDASTVYVCLRTGPRVALYLCARCDALARSEGW